MTTKIKNKTTALNVAFYFIKRGLEEKKPITNKKMQKLVYYAKAWSVTLNDEKLFNDKIEAWVHGPAVPSLYETFKKFGSDYITELPKKISFDFSEEQQEVLDSVWKVYGKYDANYLEILTHSELPWQEAREGLQGSESSNNEISLDTVKKYYSAKLEKTQK